MVHNQDFDHSLLRVQPAAELLQNGHKDGDVAEIGFSLAIRPEVVSVSPLDVIGSRKARLIQRGLAQEAGVLADIIFSCSAGCET